MRRTLPVAGLAMLAVAAISGCSSAAAPASGGTAGASSPAASSSPAAAATAPAPAPGTQAQAQTLAQQLLSSLTFPSGATPLAGPVPASLLHEGEGPVASSQAANMHQVYTVPGSMAAAFSYLKAHVPSGIGSVGSGQTTDHGAVESDELTGQQTTVPSGIYLAAMAETVVAGPDGSSLVLADAEVIWHPARSAAEYLTASHFRQIRITATMTSGKNAPVSKTLTSAADIGAVTALLDGLQAGPQVPPGNLLPPATYQLDFVPASASQPAVQVDDGGVLTESVTVGTTAQPALWDAPNSLAALIDRLAGISVR